MQGADLGGQDHVCRKARSVVGPYRDEAEDRDEADDRREADDRGEAEDRCMKRAGPVLIGNRSPARSAVGRAFSARFGYGRLGRLSQRA